MEKIFQQIEDVNKIISNIEDDKYVELFSSMSNILNDLAHKVEEINVKQESMEENMEYIGDDLTDMRDELFEEVSFEDLEEMEDEYVEIQCKECGKPLFVEKKSIDNNTHIPCPFCSGRAN